jgi:hypothetical protein
MAHTPTVVHQFEPSIYHNENQPQIGRNLAQISTDFLGFSVAICALILCICGKNQVAKQL